MRQINTLILMLCAFSSCAFAQEEDTKLSFFDFSTTFSTTEFHYQYGSNYQQPFLLEPKQQVSIYTLQHATP